MQGLRPLARYFDFGGRSGRAEYWQWLALSTVGGWIVQALQTIAEPEFGSAASAMIPVYAAATIIPQCSVAVRRLHDRGRSGWWYGLLLTTLVIATGVLIYGRAVIDQTGDRTIFITGSVLVGVWVGGTIAFLAECARPGDAYTNRYGPPEIASGSFTSQVSGRRPYSTATLSEAREQTDLVAQLRQLDDLRGRGVLTDAEFTTAKMRVLDGGASSVAVVASAKAVVGSALAPVDESAVPTNWQPASKIWQERFDFYDRHGLANSLDQRRAFKALGFWKRARLVQSFLGLLFGPFYFLYLGLWRPALMLTVAGIALGLLTDPIVEQWFPSAAESTFGPYQRLYALAFQALYAASAVPLYYLQQRYGIRTWNPFRRMIAHA